MTNKYYWLNQKSREFLGRGYIGNNQTAEERIKEISIAAENYLKVNGFADKFEDYMSRGWISLSSPIWANYGIDRGLPVSCNGSLVLDSVSSILGKVSEIGYMTKMGSGTSAYFGQLRPRGAYVSMGGESSGPVHFMELFDKTISVISQSNVRRGSMAAYLNIDHPDIEEFLDIKSEGHPIQDLSFGVCISDKWMKDLLNKDKNKLKIWAKIIRRRFESGYPYLFFTDTANNNAPNVYKNKGKKIYASNLCVTGDQRVVSNLGLLTAKELAINGRNLILFDNNKKVKSSPMKLVEKNADVYKITLENGMSHTITSYHKVCVLDKRIQKKHSPQIIKTKDKKCLELEIGDSIKIQTNKGIFGINNMQDEAFLLGLYQADGTQSDKSIMLDIWENDFDLVSEVEQKFSNICNKYNTQKSAYRPNRSYNIPRFSDCNTGHSTICKKRLSSRALSKIPGFVKGVVPQWIWEANEETQWQYIRGLYYADGTVFKSSSKGEPLQISLANINKKFLQEIQLILANLGMQSSIRILREAGTSILPDGHGGKKEYQVKDCYRLIIGNKNDALVFNKNTKFLDRKDITLENKKYRDNTKKFYKIESIEYLGKEDVYCCTVESAEHHWICNGFVTHNCNEISLSSDEDESFVCVLSSVNLLHYDEWKDTDLVEIMMFFLDSVTTEYINKTVNLPYMQHAHNFAKRQRAVGLGVLGWHSLLQSKMIPFESMQAKFLNSEIFKRINSQSLEASKKLAEFYGEPELMIGTGERMATRLAIAPTTSSSFILGQISQGIEPIDSNYFVKKLAKGNFTYKNPLLKKTLKQHNQDTSETWNSILEKGGSVQHLNFLTNEEKDVFKTFGEISQKEIVVQAAQRQKYLDQSQSLNLMILPTAPPKEVSQLLIYGWENGVKGFYYQKGANPSQLLNRSILECKSCEG